MDSHEAAASSPFSTTIAQLLAACEAAEPERIVLIAGDRAITIAEFASHARSVAAELLERGLKPGDPVVTMLGNGPNHAAIFLGICLAGALWVPLSPQARGPSLVHSLSVATPKLAFATPDAASQLHSADLTTDCQMIECDGWTLPERPDRDDLDLPQADPDTVRAILFTSGTTGPPKGVQVTERMLAASAAGTARASDCHDGDVFLMWEPLHHIGGSQVLEMALARRVHLIMVERFSASALWDQVRQHRVTKLHYLGGILEILLKTPERPDDHDHPVKLAFGGGCRPEVWRNFENRFGIPIREVYGMTEASSFTTINMSGLVGSAGTAVPWFDVDILDADGRTLPFGAPGEITVNSRHLGLFTPGYLNAPEATARLLRGGRLHSGDLGRLDESGNLEFLGRVTDSLRRRGENISAWEIETALAGHPDIAESAVIGVPAEIGEHDIMCFVAIRDGAPFEPSAIADWCKGVMPPRHIPRYWKQVSAFERTPSQRILKDTLERDPTSAFDTGK